jgi:vacuolar-type H+-ATPase subunit H
MDRRVIRGFAGPIVPATRFDAERRADGIVADAEATARRVVANAETQAKALLEAARAERERLRETQRTALARERDAILVSSTGDVLRLGLELARRITRVTLERDDAAYAGMAAALVTEARIEGPGWLRVPEGVAVSIEGFEVLEDAALAPADLVVETEGASLDARLDERLARLAAALEPPKTS